MRSKSTFVFFVVVFLASCASPAPQPTVTAVPSSTHTAAPTSTEMLEPTPIASIDQNGESGEQGGEVAEEVNMTFEDWKEIVSGPYVGIDGKTYPDKSIFFSLEYKNGIEAIYTDPAQVATLSTDMPLLVLNPSGEMRVWTSPEEAAKMVADGATVLVAKSAQPIAQVQMVLRAGGETDGQVWVVFDENPDLQFQSLSYKLERDLTVMDPESGMMVSPGMPLPPKHFAVVYYDQNGNRIVEQYGEFKDPERWVQELIEAGYEAIDFYPNPR